MNAMIKNEADTELEIYPLIKERWSTRSFSDQSVTRQQLRLLFEAARWAPSSWNEQPWRFLVGVKEAGTSYRSILESLTESNQKWAITAPILVVVCAKSTFSQNGKTNKHFSYDAGQAVAMLTIQATALGLSVHQMAGFSPGLITQKFKIPEEFQPFTAIAIGYSEGSDKNLTPRVRKPMSELCMSGEWGEPFFKED